MSIGRAWGTFLHISSPMLLSNYTAAAAGDATLLSQVGASTNGSYLAINTQRNTIDFAPTNNLPESFVYVITDTQVYRPGDTILTATNWIAVNVTNAISLVRQVTSSGSSVVITFAGVPGYKYVVERATSLAGPWTTLDGSNGMVDSQVIAPATGVWTFTETPPSSPAFYRSRQNN
jgi:cytoskeletal protein RodZ